MKIVKKSFLPILDYIYTNKKSWKKIVYPLTIALIALFCALLFDMKKSIDLRSYFSQFIDSQISIIAILISFSIAIITILVTTDNSNIQLLKRKNAEDKNFRPIKKNDKTTERLSLFQVLLSNVTYGALVQIIYLILLLVESFVCNVIKIVYLKYMCSINIFFVLHILFILYEAVVNIYFTFWKEPKNADTCIEPID